MSFQDDELTIQSQHNEIQLYFKLSVYLYYNYYHSMETPLWNYSLVYLLVRY